MIRKIVLFGIVLTGILAAYGQENNTIRLDFLRSVPKEIDGCSGLYTLDSIATARHRYIFASDLQELAFISVSGRQIRLKKTGEKQLSGNSYRTVYQAEGYVVTLVTSIKQTGDEVWLESGTIEIKKGKDKLVLKVHGESGC
jgi:hypothetical protein